MSSSDFASTSWPGQQCDIATMFSFLGSRKVSKKSTTEREADGGFVIIESVTKEGDVAKSKADSNEDEESKKATYANGVNSHLLRETVEEQRQKMQLMNIGQPSTNVVVQPSKSIPAPIQQTESISSTDPSLTKLGDRTFAVEATSPGPDLLGDIPFTLAPQVRAVQRGIPFIPDILLSNDINSMLMCFQYDFTLEKSVLNNLE
ncbi:UBAP1-MVB12-associated (UMA)-domain containing protein 1 isoform X2 [Corythoichthys intestinalis]|uniref:UBAP1-MVB12-associated (UMA)-domain containing protein 1 isoform X2 n=1 Tax=Corythoichthys intestinalis TaxID=161448 RepID=UPI0025A64925|nr:UBAP1-MVB12-associated (UMA)-domain containing protein 1 isoform X2 [Corythoichthys intestinalis]